MIALAFIIFATQLTVHAGTVNDDRIPIEEWMITPFEVSVFEDDITVDSWMTKPFESAVLETAPEVEAWMSKPFETAIFEERLEVEAKEPEKGPQGLLKRSGSRWCRHVQSVQKGYPLFLVFNLEKCRRRHLHETLGYLLQHL